MKRLAEYAGHGRYAEEDPDADRQMLADSQELVDKVVSYSREAIPRLTRDTNTALAKTPRLKKPTRAMAVGGQSPVIQRPSAIAAPSGSISAASAAIRWYTGVSGGSRSSTSSGNAAMVRSLRERGNETG